MEKIKTIKAIINKKNVKRVINVYLTVLLCVGVASMLTGCTIISDSSNVLVVTESSGALLGM